MEDEHAIETDLLVSTRFQSRNIFQVIETSLNVHTCF